MTDLYQIAVDTLHAAIKEQITFVKEPHPFQFFELLLELRANTRLYFLTPDFATHQLWPVVRANERLLDLLVDITTDWYPRFVSQAAVLNGVDTKAAYTRLTEILVQGLVGITQKDRNGNDRVTDGDFASKFGDEKTLLDLLHQELWVTVVLLLSRNLARFRLVITGIEPPAGPTGRTHA